MLYTPPESLTTVLPLPIHPVPSTATPKTFMSTTKDVKLALYTGKNKILVTNWLNLFEVVIIALKEDEDKVAKLMSYLDDDALEFYANKIAPNLSTITWAETRGLMEKRFSSSTISPIIAATRRRLTKADTVKSYFDDKMASLEKTGLSEEHMVDQLTEGLPDSYKSHLYTH